MWVENENWENGDGRRGMFTRVTMVTKAKLFMGSQNF